MKAQDLINELSELTKKNKSTVQEFKKLTIQQLNYKQNTDNWNALECIEHINRYGDFYIPEIRYRIETSNYNQSDSFKSGVIGNCFAKSMLPKEKLNTMRTFPSMNPANCLLDKTVLDTCIFQQEQLIALLEKAKNTDLTKVKTAISITKWIQLKLGDTFRIVIYHNVRHIEQAKRALKK